MKGSIPALLLLAPFAASGHELITAESAERYLAEANRFRSVLAAEAPAAQRADASNRLGAMLDEIRELLNRDLGAHGEVQGLPSHYLVSQLERLGVPLAFSPAQKRYLSNTRYFEDALKLAPSTDAGYRLLQGRFYDSFEADPLSSNESWEKLQAQIALAEKLQREELSVAQQEEVDFILAVCYVRAAVRAPAASAARSFNAKARAALGAFQMRYPDSLRTAALPVLEERLKR